MAGLPEEVYVQKGNMLMVTRLGLHISFLLQLKQRCRELSDPPTHNTAFTLPTFGCA